ncbi:hypothetical protein FHY29_002175 [Xanthomonas arboricola]
MHYSRRDCHSSVPPWTPNYSATRPDRSLTSQEWAACVGAGFLLVKGHSARSKNEPPALLQ